MTAYTQMKLRHSITIGRKRMYQQKNDSLFKWELRWGVGGGQGRKEMCPDVEYMLPCVFQTSFRQLCIGRGELCIYNRVKRYLSIYLLRGYIDGEIAQTTGYVIKLLSGRMIYRLPIVQCWTRVSWPAGKCCTVFLISSIDKRPRFTIK